MALKLYLKSVDREMRMELYGADVMPEGQLILDPIHREFSQIATRWACHAWIALRHYGRCLSAGDFVQAIQDHKTLPSHVYKDTYDTKGLFKDIGTVGRNTILRFHREAISASPIKTNLVSIDDGKGHLLERVGCFKQVGTACKVQVELVMCKKVYGKDHATFMHQMEQKHKNMGVEDIGVFLADGCAVNGVKDSEGTHNVYTDLKKNYKHMLGVWCHNHIEQLGAKAPYVQGSAELQAMLKGFDHFLIASQHVSRTTRT